MVRAPACHAGGRGFESRRSRHSPKLFPCQNVSPRISSVLRDLSKAMDEARGWDLSIFAEYRAERWFRRDRSSQTSVFLLYFTTSMNSHGIYFVTITSSGRRALSLARRRVQELFGEMFARRLNS
jgi:hypothetical protein